MDQETSRRRFGILCVLPATILLLIFMIYPAFEVFRMALYDWGGFSPNREFVGFQNFKILFNDRNFIQASQNTILMIVIVAMVTIVLAIFYAYILSTEKIKGQNFFRVVFYIPNILSIVVVAGIFSAIYNPTQGLLNSFLNLINAIDDPVLWLGDRHLVVYAVIGALIWQAVGYYMVMYMAGMANIPDSYYEAAELDGAGKLTKFFNITLPLIWNNIRTTLTFFIISTINLSFLLVQTMTGGGPNGASNTVLLYMYNQAFTNSTYGYGMAIGVVIFIFSFALSGLVSFITRREILEY